MSENEITTLLKEAHNDELETVINYQTNAIVLDGVEAEEISASLRQDVQEELQHAADIGERLDQLGDRPRASLEIEMRQEAMQPPEDSTDVLSTIEGVIEAEEDAVETYRELVEAAEDRDDPVTEDLATELLADEEEHLSEFEGYRKEYVAD